MKFSFLKYVMVHITIILKYISNAVKVSPNLHLIFHFSEGFKKALVKKPTLGDTSVYFWFDSIH